MAIALKDLLLGFIVELRTAGVRISPSESLDAMNAIAAGLLARSRMREALRATLIKEEPDSAIFNDLFNRRFGSEMAAGEPRDSRGAQIGVSGRGWGGGAGAPPPQPASSSEDEVNSTAKAEPFERHSHSPPTDAGTNGSGEEDAAGEESREAASSPAEEEGRGEGEARDESQASPSPLGSSPGLPSAGQGRVTDIMTMPFASYSDLEYEQARDALAALKRRIRIKLGRRMRTASHGRIDFRRTIRASIQRGGSLGDLRFRSRRPRHVDLVVLGDISGSVRYASTLSLELMAGARSWFHKAFNFVYIDSLAEADFERGHLVMSPMLDSYARSDFGRVLAQLLAERLHLLSRATVLVIIGDGRNNRRPARLDLLREIGRRVRAIVWLNPEQPERWGTGDSAILQYAREVDAMLSCANLRALEFALGRII